jgi:uncharacterized protein (TIGR02466 family)
MNQIKEEIMFFSPIYWTELQNINNKKIIKEVYKLQKKYISVNKSNFGGWQSPSEWENEDLKNTEILILLKEINKIAQEISSKWNIKIFLDNFWININKKNNFNVSHIHPYSSFSGTYYIQTNNDSGKIVFERPDNQYFVLTSNKNNKYRFGSYSINPKNNMLIFFSSNIPHYVETNISNQDRISLAFNFKEENNL